MLGQTLFRVLRKSEDFTVCGTMRQAAAALAANGTSANVIGGISVENFTSVRDLIVAQQPDVIINCIGIVKQLDEAKYPLPSIRTNALFPHQLAEFCDAQGAKLIHFSTDCVFSGEKGNYRESDEPDPVDLYGRTKWLGEVASGNALTLRTSIIGHGVVPNRSLIDWFLAQHSEVGGYSRAIYSGLPTVEVATLLRDVVLRQPELKGLYHVASQPISKLELLHLVRSAYGLETPIKDNPDFVIDRSLDASRFNQATGYKPPPWRVLVERMHADWSRGKCSGGVQ